MRILLGFTDVANITANYEKGFRALGHQVFSVVWNKSYFYPDEEYSLVIDDRKPGEKDGDNPLIYIKMALRMTRLVKALNCDLFLMAAPAMLPTQLYYPVLKLFGKKIITAFLGSDVRYWYAFAEEMRSYGVYEEMSPFFEYARTRSGGSYWDKQRTVRVAEKYSDIIVSCSDSGQLQIQPYIRGHVPLDLSEFRFNVPGRIKPLILHAPSVPEAKGTNVVLNAIKELQEEGLEFEFRLIEKMPHKELRNLLTEADIVIDELYSATIGGLSSEAMATGNVVLVRYMAEYSKVPPGCPAVNTTIFTLKENLRRVILNVEERKDLANRGRVFVETYNDNVKICKKLLNLLEQKDKIEYDFYPTFYKNFSVPEYILEEEKRETKSRRAEFFKVLLSTGTTKKKQD